ncbi:reverse transcriptase domain-containing protein [Tanacetum coccineum]
MTSPTRGGGPEGQDGREGTPPLTKEQIEGHISAMKSIIKDHNKRNKANPIRLNFEIEDQDPNEGRIVKGKEIDDEDLSKPFKETLKTPFTRRIIEFSGPEYSMPTNIALYNGSTDPADHLNRFVGAANSGEWPMPVWCRMFQQTLDGSARGWFESLPPNSIDEWWRLREAFTTRYSTRKACYKEPHEITKIVRKANETLTAFKERWTVETGFIIGVPEVMKISSFMDSVKSPELAKRFASNVPKTVNEMMKRLDEFVRAEEAYALAELPPGESRDIHRRLSFPAGSRDVHQRLTFPAARRDDRDGRNSPGKDFRKGDYRNSYKVRDNFNTGRHRDYRAPYPQREQTNRAVPVLSLDSLTKCPKEILATETQLQLPPPRPVANPLRTGDPDKYCDYHQDKGHHTNDCIQLRKQLEIALESGKLNHLMKDLRQRVERRQNRNPPVQKTTDNRSRGDEWISRKAGLWDEGSSSGGSCSEHASRTLPKESLKILHAIPSTIHSMIKFPTPKGIATLIARTITIAECRLREEKQMIREETPQEEEGVDVTEQIIVNPSFPDQMVTIGGRLSKGCKEQLKTLLKGNMEVFAWEPADMTGVPRRVIEHALNVNPSLDPDYYPLPNIDCKVEAVMGFKYKCFLDAYKGYHQIQMAKEDEEKTAFYTEQGTYCYTKMPFGLKNAGATYQRLVDSTFQSQIGRNLEAYVDDMVIKSKEETSLLADIAETFEGLKTINMKLNPKKCSFGVEEGKFLGYMVTSEGIRANPKKTKAISNLQSPKTLKEMQSLSGKLASLNRFLAKSAERALPFFNTLKNITKENKHEYRWTPEAEEAFQQMKRLIMSLPSLTPPFPEETLYAYLAVSTEAVSAVLLTDRNGRQCPVQYVSRTLNEAERNYSPLEKLALSLVNMTRRLRRYFEAHPVKVITDQPIKNILSRTEASGKLAKYAVEIGTYKISFIPRNAVKGQVLADFLSDAPDGEREDEYFQSPEVSPGIDDTEAWTLYTDGAASSKGSGAGLILTGPSGVEYAYALRLTFASTNNEAEYEALLAGLRIARMMKVLRIEVKVDSKLVASQINGMYEASNGSMIKYLAKAREYISEFKTFSIENIPRGSNQKADVLSKLATVPFHNLTKEILVEVLNERSTEVQEVQTIVEEEGDNWMTPIIKYLEEGIVPSDSNEARALRAKIGQYTMESGVLFKKGYLIPMLRCVGPLQANYVIREIHMGSCGMHVGPRAVVRKAMRQGYYWPTMHADAKTEVDKCDSCQIHSPIPRLPKTFMTSIMAPWPFYQWGMDILGPLTPARGGAKFVVVAIDYFTKWVEAKPLVKITGKEIIRFVMDNIICRYGLPRIIVTDNGAQLVNDPFKSWCKRFEIQQMNTAVAHPQANGLVERANRSLMEGIKTRLGREKAGWVDELPNVLWAHRTSIKQSNGETPFSLTYGSEAVIPAEIGIPSYRTLMIREEYNEEEQRLNLDLLQERREAAAIREAKYKTKMEQYYNKRVRPAGFRPGEFVYRRNEASRIENEGKLGPNWEGPYRVTEAFENGSYKLQTMEDKVVPRTWHAVNLRKCYL